MQKSEQRQQRQRQLQDPIVDALYDRCVDFMAACDSRDEARKRRLFGSIQEFWYQRYMAGERLPLPNIPDDQLTTSDDIYIDQVVGWVSAIMRQLEARRGVSYVG